MHFEHERVTKVRIILTADHDCRLDSICKTYIEPILAFNIERFTHFYTLCSKYWLENEEHTNETAKKAWKVDSVNKAITLNPCFNKG